MSYLDVYFSRINHFGETTSERARNQGIRSFERWLQESPHTVENLSVERGIYFSGIILTHKDRDEKKLLKLNVANDIPLQVGDILNWCQDNGEIEKWILLSEEKKVNGNHRSFEIILCNYLVKWVDQNGHLQQSWAYVLSSTDDKIKGNFRTWHNLISPQPNKFAEIIMPRREINKGTNFIIEDENWKLIEFDYTSVKGIIYLSLTEYKVNFITDDLVNDIADADQIANYRLDIPSITQIFKSGDIVNPVFTLMKNGIPCDEEIEWTSNDKSIIKVIDGQLVAQSPGTVTIVGTLKNFPSISQELEVTVGDAEQEFSAYIEGEDTIKLARYQTYKLIGTSQIEQDNVLFHIEMVYSQEELDKQVVLNPSDYAKVTYDSEQKCCVVHANSKNKLHVLKLIAVYNNQQYEKNIKIVPLW